MEKDFDPYYKWLGIPPRDQPPNHYRLLGIEVFEEDRDVIDAAANRVMGYLKDLAVGDEAQYSQKMLNEVSRARLCLLNREKKTSYDADLKAQLSGRPGEVDGRSGNGSGPPAVAPPLVKTAREAAGPLSPVRISAPTQPGSDVHIKTAEGAPRNLRNIRKAKGDSNPARSPGPHRRLGILIGVLLALASVGAVVLIVSLARDSSSAGPGAFRPVALDPSWPLPGGNSGTSPEGATDGGQGVDDVGRSQEPTPQTTNTGTSGSSTPEAANDSPQSPEPHTLAPPKWPPGQGSSPAGSPSALPSVDRFDDPYAPYSTSVVPAPSPAIPPWPAAVTSGSQVPAATAPDPPAPAAEPFADLPAAVTLPQITVATPHRLGEVHLQPQDPCSVTLCGGERATRGAIPFSLRPVGSGGLRVWDILLSQDGGSVSVARLAIDADNQLTFAWDAAAADLPPAPQLCNCALVLSAPGAAAPHVLRLREPVQQDAIEVDLSKASTKADLKLEHLPQADAIIIEIVGLDGAEAKLDMPLSTHADDGQVVLDVVDGGGLLLLEIKAQLKRSLQLQITPRLRPAAGERPDLSDLRTVTRKLEDLLALTQNYIRQLVMQELQLGNPRLTSAQRVMIEQEVRQNLAPAQAQLLHLQELQKLLTTREKKLGLRLRIYFQADPEQIELLHLGEQGI